MTWTHRAVVILGGLAGAGAIVLALLDWAPPDAVRRHIDRRSR